MDANAARSSINACVTRHRQFFKTNETISAHVKDAGHGTSGSAAAAFAPLAFAAN